MNVPSKRGHLGEYLGALLTNLMALETSLRFLRASHEGITLSFKGLVGTNVGDEIPEDPFNDYAQLKELLAWYNGVFPSERIDEGPILDLRHALAHGRMYFENEEDTKLVKFSPPKKGKVQVTYAARVNEAWFEAQRELLREATDTVLRVGGRRGLFGPPIPTSHARSGGNPI